MGLISKIASSKIGAVGTMLAVAGTGVMPITYNLLSPPAVYAQESESSSVRELEKGPMRNCIRGLHRFMGNDYDYKKEKHYLSPELNMLMCERFDQLSEALNKVRESIEKATNYLEKRNDGILKGSDGMLKGSDGMLKGSDGMLKGSDGMLKGNR